MKHSIQQPNDCRHQGLASGILSVDRSDEEQIVLSCSECQMIWLWAPGTPTWSVAWRAREIGKNLFCKIMYGLHKLRLLDRREEKLRPWRMCRGVPGQIIAVNGISGESVTVFDVTQIPFRVMMPEIKLNMTVKSMCFIPDHDIHVLLWGCIRFLAVTDTSQLVLLRSREDHVYSLNSMHEMEVSGCKDICSTTKGHIFVIAHSGPVYAIDNHGVAHIKPDDGILVFSGKKGELLQEMKHDEMDWPDNVFWCDKMAQLIVKHDQDKISYFEIKCELE